VALGINFSLQSQQGLVSIVFPSIRISTLSCFLTDTWHNARRIYLEEIIRNILNHYPLTDYWHTHASSSPSDACNGQGILPASVYAIILDCPRVVCPLSTQLVTLRSLYIPLVAFWRLNLVLQQSCRMTA